MQLIPQDNNLEIDIMGNDHTNTYPSIEVWSLPMEYEECESQIIYIG